VKADLLENSNTTAKRINKLDFQTCQGLPETKSIKLNMSLTLPTLGVLQWIMLIEFLGNFMMRNKTESHLGSQSSSFINSQHLVINS